MMEVDVLAARDYVVVDKKSVFIDKRAKVGKNVIIYENCRIEGESVIEDNVTIFPNCFLSNSIIGKGTKIYSAIIENSKIGGCSSIGPYCHMRASVVGDFVHVGDFSVLKQANVSNNEILEPFSHIFETRVCSKKKKGN